MERKDEIIRMQNEIMQGLLRQRMQLIGEDLWGIKPDTPPETPKKKTLVSIPQKKIVEADVLFLGQLFQPDIHGMPHVFNGIGTHEKASR